METKNGGSSSSGAWVVASSETSQILRLEVELTHEDSNHAIPVYEESRSRMGIETL